MSIKENIKSFKNMNPHDNKQDDYLTCLLLNKLRQSEIDHLVECLLKEINQ
ncbi:MAG TPA: hypothetical protein VIK78_00055 [Ruminiclostridium sp.]